MKVTVTYTLLEIVKYECVCDLYFKVGHKHTLIFNYFKKCMLPI